MERERKVEVLVGLFLLIGLTFIAVMVITFGKVGQTFTDHYAIDVEFPNASGLVKDSDVLLAGARIGYVAEPPRLTGKSYSVVVRLNVREEVKIPRKSTYLVGSSGLLGDRFVDVIPQPDFDPNDVVAPGDQIAGKRATGMDDLTAKGGVVMDQLSVELEEIRKMTAALNQRLLSEANLKNLEETFANLKTTTASFNDSAKKLDGVLDSAQGAVDSAKSTMKTADGAATDLRAAIGDFRKTANAATSTMESAKGLVASGQTLLKQAREGDGALGLLMSDRKTAEDLRVFVANLRKSGVLFYKNRPLPAPTPAERPARQ